LPAARQVSALYPGTSKASDPVILRLADDIAAFLDGWDVKFGLDRVGMDLCSPFQQRVLRAEHGVPRGRVTTYGRLARHLGRPKAARAVGNCLATNPFPIVIPCHRAIRSDGTLGGYQGGVEMKRALLEMEGVRFDPSGRVLAEGFHY
jgi:methylated-DNA-[protein]-cysteine S-methyltransferase